MTTRTARPPIYRVECDGTCSRYRHRHDVAPETCTPCHCDLPNLPDAINYLNAHRPACTGPHTIYKVAVARLATTPGKKAS
jgi:hypothetical protein